MTIKPSHLVSMTAAILAMTALSGCTSRPDVPTPPQPTIQTTVVAPIVLNVNELNGVTVDLTQGNSLDVVVPADQVADWTGTSSDTSVAEFKTGSTGQSIDNPSVTAIAPGTATVTMSYGEKTITFTINVT